METAAVPGAIAAPRSDHVVRFYERDEELLREVTGFLQSALDAGGTAIAIATPEHRAELARRLDGAGGRLQLHDAHEMLECFMDGERPDAARFDAAIEPLLRPSAAGKPLHAFGEMVAALCQAGNYDGALALERLWNALLARHRFALFCGYPWSLFGSRQRELAFQHVCEAHTEVRHSGAARTAAELEQQVRALTAEVERHESTARMLRERERELVEFVENAVEGIHKVAADGTILYANRAELRMLGYEWHEYVGHHIAEFYVDKAHACTILDKLGRGEVLKDEPAVLRGKDGSPRHVLVCSNACIEDGQFRYTRCFTRDATDRMAREKATRQRNTIVALAPVGAVLLSGEELRFDLANEAYCKLVGRTDVIGRRFAEVFPELEGSKVERLLREAMRSGTPQSREEYRIAVDLGRGIETRYLKFNLQPLPAEAGSPPAIIGVVVDVTEHVRVRRELEASVAERERLLQGTREASRAKDEFLAMLGHELRNPLSPIVTALQLMRMRGETGTQREQEVIQRQVDHMVRMIDDLLDVSRVARGNIELKRQPSDVSKALANSVEQVSVLLEQRKHELQIDVAPALWCDCDPVRIAQVFANLLTNAARYTPPGGRIELRARRAEPAQIEVSVKDSGAGIAADVLPNVFDLFFQGPRGVDRAEGGLGVGLAIVRSLVQLHGGTVQARSEGPGHGSEFIVRLPEADRAAPADPPGAAAAAVTRPGGRRVLVVDDNVDAAETLGELLRVEGHTVSVLHDPVSALKAVQAGAPEFALLDIGLPVMSGYELAARIREVCGDRCRLIALTGYGQEADKERSRSAGFDRHLVKPVGAADLSSVLREP